MEPAFFEPDGDGFVASPLTRGPWDEHAQHGGPPAALLARAVEVGLPPAFRLARLTVDLLRPVPIGRVTPRVVLRKGPRVARADVGLVADGVEVMRGTALAQRVGDVDVPADDTAGPAPGDDDGDAEDGDGGGYFAVPWDEGYHTAMRWRFVRGGWTEVGAARVWMAQRVALVAGEAPSPAQRVVVVADSGNGVSAAVERRRFSFVNADLTVHLHRDPVGEWIGMDATTVAHRTGAALATTTLFDRRGPVGSGNQSLVITPHTAAGAGRSGGPPDG